MIGAIGARGGDNAALGRVVAHVVHGVDVDYLFLVGKAPVAAPGEVKFSASRLATRLGLKRRIRRKDTISAGWLGDEGGGRGWKWGEKRLPNIPSLFRINSGNGSTTLNTSGSPMATVGIGHNNLGLVVQLRHARLHDGSWVGVQIDKVDAAVGGGDDEEGAHGVH